MSSEFSFLSKDDDQRWWLIGFLIVSILFAATLVSVALGRASQPEMNVLSGLLIAVFIGCGAFLGGLFVDRAGTACGLFDEHLNSAQPAVDRDATIRQQTAKLDLERQTEYYLRRVYREFGPDDVPAEPQYRSSPATPRQSIVVHPPRAANSAATSGSATSATPATTRPATSSSPRQSQQPKSLAEWTPPANETASDKADPNGPSKRPQRRDWVA